ncbi:hypothetical protein BSK56_21190 [Paenibacillus borealis]|uniref:Tyr recombinase domain-containing protein n=1 Tax=Paenibacillus borealis TaxID=160799 RepID=A0ABX3H356_PAEBO|nr:hypothetical protein BSK56_21190 [Paenibacillus borealis]
MLVASAGQVARPAAYCWYAIRESGSDLKTIQERIRHAKLDMSVEYTHEFDIINREVVDKLVGLNPKNIKFAP